jgi:integrase
MPRRKLTPAFCRDATALPGAERTIYWHEKREGFGLMVTSKGQRSFVVQYRANGRSRRMTIDGQLSLDKAEKQAKILQGRVGQGGDPVEEQRKERAGQTNTLRAVAEEFFAREGKKMRSIDEREAVFRRYIFPRFGTRAIDSIKRSEIVRMLDQVEDANGSTAAQHALAALRRLFNWHASRDDDFLSPVVRGMARIKPKEQARDRVLTDDELRIIWKTAEDWQSPYAAMLRFILLTATRLREASDMNRGELNKSGAEWTIPARRHKSKKDFVLPLSDAAQALLKQLPKLGNGGWVFSTSGATSISGFSKFKTKMDELVLEKLRKHDPEAKPLPTWTTHDLRRTARSLMSRASVAPDHAERALGHVIGGIRETYDRHEYVEEKRQAFEALAAQLERIINPKENVVQLRTATTS